MHFKHELLFATLLCLTTTASRSEAQPSVSLSPLGASTTFLAPAWLPLAATATPSDGAGVASVSFLQAGSLLGQATAVPYGYVWGPVLPGSYSLQASVLDSLGQSAVSTSRSATVLAAYIANFEDLEGYAVGSLDGQLGWSVTQGAAEVVASAAYFGTRSVTLAPSTPVTRLTNPIASTPTQGVTYFDFFAKPAADPAAASSSLIDAGSARMGAVPVGQGAGVRLFNGDGVGGGAWVAPARPSALSLDATGATAAGWHRFTVREDFSRRLWDLYVDGQMVARDIGFASAPADSSVTFSMRGHATAPASFAALYVSSINPLFTNAANDGIDDAWKAQYGLDPSVNLRSLSLNGNGTALVDYYIAGVTPVDFFNGRALAQSFPAPSNQITYTYDSSGRMATAAFAGLATQSFVFDNAANLTSVTGTAQPIVAWRVANGLPPDGSGSGADGASPAGDNLPNLVKYGLGLPAMVPAQGAFPTVTLLTVGSQRYLGLQYQRPEPAPADLSYSVEVSANGQDWLSAPGATVIVSSVSSGGQAFLQVRDATPVSTPQFGRLIRLRISRALVTQ